MKLNLFSNSYFIQSREQVARLTIGFLLTSMACVTAASTGCDTGTYKKRLNEAPPVAADTVPDGDGEAEGDGESDDRSAADESGDNQ